MTSRSLAADGIDRFLQDYEAEVASRQVGQPHLGDSGPEPHLETTDEASLRDAGILGSFRNRNEALARFNPQLQRAHRVVVVGSSLKGLIHPGGASPETREILRERVSRQHRDKDGLITTDFVLTHPAFADLRAQQENRANLDIGREVIKSLMYLMHWSAEASSIHLYLGTPTCFGILAGDKMVLNPYPYADVAFQSPCLLLQGNGYFFNAFALSHFGVLDQTMVVRLSDLPADIGDLYLSLDDFRERTDKLLGTARKSTSRPVTETESDLESMEGFLDLVHSAMQRREQAEQAKHSVAPE